MKNKSTLIMACIGLTAVGAVGLWGVEREPTDDDDYSKQVAAAIQETAEVLRGNLACPSDPAEFDRAVIAMWPHLHPELANRERERDPKYLAAREAALNAGLNAKQFVAERMKDPAFAARRRVAEAALQEGLVDRRVAEEHVIRQAEVVRSRGQAKRGDNVHADGGLQ